MNWIQRVKFDNSFVRELNADPNKENFTRQVPGAHYSLVQPSPVKNPQILLYSKSASQLLDIDFTQEPQAKEIFSGNLLLPQMTPVAARYGGHQFGNWAGQLGDGRAITLGEIINQRGERWEIQLKGAGPTPYSRTADGRAVLRSSVREYICSEAMYYLGVPTTRALCCITTGESVIRDMFYDGNPQSEPGAIVTRLAPTFLRFGNYQIHAAQQETTELKKLVDYTIKYHFSHLEAVHSDRYSQWYQEVCRRTAELMVHWQRVGFVHGVMNTDNMSILGITIDYGPYGWMDVYEPDWTPNTTDFSQRRYRYAYQPSIAKWNLAALGQALVNIALTKEQVTEGLELFETQFVEGYHNMMANKLGLNVFRPQDQELYADLEALLLSTETDMTLFYYYLGLWVVEPLNTSSEQVYNFFKDCLYQEEHNEEYKKQLFLWLNKYSSVVAEATGPKQAQALMQKTNPVFIPRNYLVQQALEKHLDGDKKMLEQVCKAIETPYEVNQWTQAFIGKRPEWARNKPGSSTLSCSS